jgi:hypothetical protein
MNRIKYIGFEVLTAVMTNYIFWDVTQCSLLISSVLEEHVVFNFRVEE